MKHKIKKMQSQVFNLQCLGLGKIALLSFFCLGAQNLQAMPVKVVNLNIWGLPVPIVWDAKLRYQQFRNQVLPLNPDFILLDEVFSPKAKIQLKMKEYPYFADGIKAKGRLTGSGLRILSKHPILRVAKMGYGACKKDDCLARKGALLVVVKLPDGQNINVVNTHLNARGGDIVRAAQVKQMKKFVDDYAEPNAPILIGGDFNASAGSGTYYEVLKSFPVVDVWAQIRGNDPGYTYDTHTNHYARAYAARTSFPDQQDRIDFQFVSSHLIPKDIRVVFNTAPLLSDHYGLMAEYELVSNIVSHP